MGGTAAVSAVAIFIDFAFGIPAGIFLVVWYASCTRTDVSRSGARPPTPRVRASGGSLASE